MKECNQAPQMMHPVSLCLDGNQWGWNTDHLQKLSLPGQERNNPHILVQAGSGLVMAPCLWTRINIWLSNKTLHWPGVNRLINLIPNNHTGITRLHAHHGCQVDCVIGWTQTWKEDPSLPWREGVALGDCWAPKAICPTILLEWLKDSWAVKCYPCLN